MRASGWKSKCAAALLGLALLGPAAALAVNSDSGEYIYPGAMCVPTETSSDQEIDDVFYYYGVAQNRNDYDLDLYCPSLRNRPGGSYDSGSWVYVYDGNPNGGQMVSCQLIARQSDNPSGAYKHSDQDTGYYGTGYTKLTFGDPGYYSNGYHYIHCTLPERYGGSGYSVVTGYYVKEES